MTARRVLLLGLDGMTYSVLDPAFEAGHMPVFKRLLEKGASGVLTSTVPPYTPPGWTSIFTGVNPGKHGIFGFTLGNVQSSKGLVSLDRVTAPAVWNAANAQGVRMGLFNIPMTYPAPAIDGFAVSGMLTPEGGGKTPENFTHPLELRAAIEGVAPGYEIDIQVDYDQDWKSTAIIERLSANLAKKRAALAHLMESHDDLGLLFGVLEAPDRLMHVHYKYIDPRCEHFHRPEAAAIRERAWAFFDEMDGMIGDMLAWAGNDGFVVTMSDHGFGPKDKSVNVNLALREWGLLSIGGAGAVTKSAGVRTLARKAKKVLPKSVWQKAKGAAQASIDWGRTKAFSAPIPQQGIYVNLEGREPHGVVPQSEYEAVRDEIVARFSELVDPDDGQPVLDRIYRREEVLSGPQAPDAPDLFPVCRAYSYELSDGLYSPGVLDDYRGLPRGFHHMDGIFGIAGPGIEPRTGLQASLYDIMPTALYLAGLKIPEVDGRVLTEWLPEAMVTGSPPAVEAMDLPLAGSGAEASPYSAEDEAAIEESLRNLGYL
ncbi:MAG TPA: alkaline phosphatase family protein [Actinomycetota bacterium]|nr:alkaline phosphatase family protein [Actinomycetota bacterium]